MSAHLNRFSYRFRNFNCKAEIFRVLDELVGVQQDVVRQGTKDFSN